MAIVSSREGVLRFTADGDESSPSDPAAQIYTIIVQDPTGASEFEFRKGSSSGPIVFHFTPNGVAGTYPFYFYGTLTTGSVLYFAGTGAADVYIR